MTNNGSSSAAEAALRNFYGSIMTGRDLARLELVARHTPEEILMGNWHLVQARILEILDGGARMSAQARQVAMAVDVMVEQEQLEAEYAEYVKLLLRGGDLDRLTNIMTQASTLPEKAARLREEGNLKAQVVILQEFLMITLQQATERHVLEAGINAITRLKLQGGIPQRVLDQFTSVLGATTVEAEALEGEEDDPLEDYDEED